MTKKAASVLPEKARPMDTYRACEIVEGFDGQEHTREEIVEAVQHLIDTRAIFSLQGMYGRLAADLVGSGDCHAPREEDGTMKKLREYDISLEGRVKALGYSHQEACSLAKVRLVKAGVSEIRFGGSIGKEV